MTAPSSEPSASSAHRLVALGASNLTRLLPALTRAGGFTEVRAACGYGRSYGAPSWFLLRRRGGIDTCGLWNDLTAGPGRGGLGLVTDVGNDILYGFDVPWILARVRSCAERLRAHCDELVVTGLPLDSIAKVGRLRWLLLRTVLVPGCRIGLAEAKRRARQLDEELRAMADGLGARFVELPGTWYGVDPIHVVRRRFPEYCTAVLGGRSAPAGPAPVPRQF